MVHARALFEPLLREFGDCEVFIDLEGIDYGLDFVDRRAKRRIDRESDYVRTEIVTALQRGIRTVPVLIEGAEMPDSSELPEDLRPLARKNALILDFNRFDAEVGRLIGVIRKILTAEVAAGSPRHPQETGVVTATASSHSTGTPVVQQVGHPVREQRFLRSPQEQPPSMGGHATAIIAEGTPLAGVQGAGDAGRPVPGRPVPGRIGRRIRWRTIIATSGWLP